MTEPAEKSRASSADIDLDGIVDAGSAGSLDPTAAELDPTGHTIIETVCHFYGVDAEELTQGTSLDKFVRPRAVSIYLLREQLGLPGKEIMELVKRSQSAVSAALTKTQADSGENPLLRDEIEYLKTAGPISLSINQRIFMRVSEATGVTEEDIMAGQETEAAEARQLAIYALYERGHLGSGEISDMFGMRSRSAVYRSREVIDLARSSDALLDQRLGYVRAGVFSEEPGTFIFDPESGAPVAAEPGDHDGLPRIDETLVAPKIREQVYRIIGHVAGFYEVPATEIIGQSKEVEVSQARKAAVLLCRQSHLPSAAIAVCFGGRPSTSILRQAKEAAERARDDESFAEDIRDLQEGRPRRDVLGDTMEAVAEFYGVEPADIAAGEDYWSARARRVFVTMMAGKDYAPHKKIGEVIGRNESATAALAIKTRERLEHDPRLKAEIAYLSNPDESPRPPTIQDILESVGEAFGIKPSRILEASEPEEQLARRLTVCILIDELSLPYKDIAEMLGVSTTDINWYIRQTRHEMDRHPKRILEIDRLKPPASASITMATRILDKVRERFMVDLSELSSRDQAPYLDRARSVAINLLQKAGYDVDQIVGLLEVPKSYVINKTEEAFVNNK